MIKTEELPFVYKKIKGKKIEVFYNNGKFDKNIGTLYIFPRKRIYYKKVISTKHKMRLFEGYGIQKEVFDKYLRGRVGKIVINEIDTDVRLDSDIKDWEEKGRSANFGEEKQIFLSVKYMRKYKPVKS